MLVMLSPDAEYDQKPTATLPNGRVINVHDLFLKSGVYDASTLEPAWQVGWFAQRRDLLCSDDLQHIAWLNRQGFRSSWAIAFYDGGKLVRTYQCASLLTGMKGDWCLPYSTWDWHTRWYDRFDLDADRRNVLLSSARRQVYVMGYEVDLGRQERYSFDLASGTLVSKQLVGAWIIWAYGFVFVSLMVAFVIAARWVSRKIRAPGRRRGFAVGQ
jgi:hypothetical protein